MTASHTVVVAVLGLGEAARTEGSGRAPPRFAVP